MIDIEILEKLNSENEWFKPKHIAMYRDITFRAAEESSAIRRKVGAVILSPNGSLFIGYNGTPSKHDNCCEDENFESKDDVIHAEHNAIMKMVNEKATIDGSIMFITDSPCKVCVNNVIIKYGIKAVFYFRYYRLTEPLEILKSENIFTQYVDENYLEELRVHNLKR